MISFQNIKTIANYERKILFRSWFFKIFSIIAIVALTIFHIVTNFDTGADEWIFRALPSNIPYTNIKLLNVIQSIIAIFLASGFLKKDKKLDTTVVIYVRPMSNLEYVLGKTIGGILLFLGLNFISITIGFGINVATANYFPDIFTYLLYPIIISIPSLIFVFGLAFTCMSFIKNQPLTFILLLGYVGVSIFYLGSHFDSLYDYTSFNLPLVYSDMIGFSNLTEIILHRCGYLFIGIGLIFLTIVKIERLSNSKKANILNGISSFIFILLGIGLLFNIFYIDQKKKENRKELVEINKAYYSKANIQILENSISLAHKKDIIDCSVKLKIKNTNNKNLKSYYLSLNPGLEVYNIINGSNKLSYTRKGNIIVVIDNIAKNETKTINIKYKGSILTYASYLDISYDKIKKANTYFNISIPNESAFISNKYTVLTQESNWYPTAGLDYNPGKSAIGRYRFSKYDLKVKTNADMSVFSQGNKLKNKDGIWHFKTDIPYTQLSLIIGKYKTDSVTIDSIKYSVNYMEGHNYYKNAFESIKDTIPSLIKNMMIDYEIKQKRKYPYYNLSLVEVPAQFHSFKRLWTNHNEVVQPSMILVPEVGLTMPDSDFEGRIDNIYKWRSRNNKNLKKKDIVVNTFSRVIYDIFFSDQTAANLNNNNNHIMGMTSFNEQIYSIYPNFYTFTNHIHSEKYPLIDGLIENITKDETASRRAYWQNRLGGVNDNERANLILQKYNLKEVLEQPIKFKDSIGMVVNNKAKYFKALFLKNVGKEQLREDLARFYNQNKFKSIKFEDFEDFLFSKYKLNLKHNLSDWYLSKKIPGYILSDLSSTKVIYKDEEKFQIKLKIKNDEDVSGLINFKIVTRSGNKGNRRSGFSRRMANAQEYSYMLEAHKAYEIGILSNSKPISLQTNTLVSKNIPNSFNKRFEKYKKSEEAPFEGIREIKELKTKDIIVDNEDPGFSVQEVKNEKILKRFVNSFKTTSIDRYKKFYFWRPPTAWTLFAQDGQYGKYVKSGYYCNSGDGSRTATWEADIKESGFYEVYFYYSASNKWSWRRNRNKSSSNYKLDIYADSGIEKLDLDISQANETYKWLPLGSFYFSKGKAKVVLNNKTNNNYVIADAIKWVKKK